MNGNTLIGAQVPQVWSATVHSQFKQAINLITKQQRLITLVTNPLWISEYNIVITDHVLFNQITNTSTFDSDHEFLFINQTIAIEYQHCKIWSMPILNTLDKTAIRKNLLQLQQALIRKVPSPLSDIIEEQFRKTSQRFLHTSQADFSCIIGAGQGLTPSGDDMLVGFALALFAFSPNKLNQLAKHCKPLLNNTTDISRYLLIDAFNGKFSAPLINLFISLNSNVNLDETLNIALNIGHSSGQDALFGLYHGLRYFLK